MTSTSLRGKDPNAPGFAGAVMLWEMQAHATLAPGQKYPGIGEASFSRTDVVNQPATWKAFVSIVMVEIISSNRGCR